jgi:hypothetical protein
MPEVLKEKKPKKGGVTRIKFVPYKRDDIILLRVKITLEP